ncbi:hypothetical protein [Deinococcus sp. PEB2-67]
MSIKSKYPWQKGPDWGKERGVVATLEMDGHRFEITKIPYLRPAHHIRAQRSQITNTSRYRLFVDGVMRGSQSPRLYSTVAEADAMISWNRAALAQAQAGVESGA